MCKLVAAQFANWKITILKRVNHLTKWEIFDSQVELAENKTLKLKVDATKMRVQH